ncbi:RNA polymerase sigma factor [Pedobacter sp. AK017]|uniref:RNA polymerase sigma factor n=1 Tax=Pedobacter sp. AK017 TaxID=2723073 RepID=UPI001616612D|nr:RNA polymerase sigma-70 factor [Pedobacter sp. AK017]
MKDYTTLSDADLILSWKEGDEQAFSNLYKMYVMPLMRLAVSKTNSREIAEELVQNSFVKLYEHKRSIETNTSVQAYLFVILKNQILNHYRSQLVRNKYELHIAKHANAEDHSLIEQIESRELAALINMEIEKLPPKCREVFILSRKGFLSNKEIAAKLDISENTVEQHIRKAISKLRMSLGQLIELGVVIYVCIMLR